MDEIIPGLWIGDLRSAQNADNLKAHGIFSILSAMRGRITIHETFIRHQIKLDDTEDADILMHFLPSIHFIQAELDKGRGVLVHCMAGVSRSTTIVAAYLMYSREIDPQAALALIKKARPFVEPNNGFLQQLDLFHDSRYKITRREKAVRMFYMDRVVQEVMNGDGSLPATNMFANFPQTPSNSVPSTPGGPRRRIRCKMCRQELATREHMLDHGQLGPATPVATTPAGSRRPSTTITPNPLSRAQSGSAPELPRRSARASFSNNLGESLTMSAIQEHAGEANQLRSEETDVPSIMQGTPGERALQEFRDGSKSESQGSGASLSALEIEGENEDGPSEPIHPTKTDSTGIPEEISMQASQLLGRRLSDAVLSPLDAIKSQNSQITDSFFTADGNDVAEYSVASPETTIDVPTTHLVSPIDLVAQLHDNPKLSALRSPSINSGQNILKSVSIASAPILANPKCSGYFLEPMKWMEHFLSSGQMAGKITCPNKKCSAKLGNFDWAGVCCGCKEWVTPGFCINRSKVDEVI